MTKAEQKQKYAAPWQIVLMVIGFVVMTPIYLISIFLLVSIYIIYPVNSTIDRAKFERIDSFSKSIYDQFVTKSGGIEKWTYSKKCEDRAQGFIGYDGFNCSTTSYTQIDVTSALSVKELNDKYLSIFAEQGSLSLRDSIMYSPATFGIQFKVSSAVSRYDLRGEKAVLCTYDVQLDQSDKDNSTNEYGEDIDGKTGVLNISFKCEARALGDWYN